MSAAPRLRRRDCSIRPPDTGDRWIFYETGDYRIAMCSPDEPYTEEAAQELREAFE